MVEIGGRLLLWHIMRRYAGHGFDEFLTLEGIEELYRSRSPFDCAVLLTGQDCPIKPNSVIGRTLAEGGGNRLWPTTGCRGAGWTAWSGSPTGTCGASAPAAAGNSGCRSSGAFRPGSCARWLSVAAVAAVFTPFRRYQPKLNRAATVTGWTEIALWSSGPRRSLGRTRLRPSEGSRLYRWGAHQREAAGSS